MVYTVHGFNFLCNTRINKYCEYIMGYAGNNLPTVRIIKADNSNINMPENVEISNDFCTSKHSAEKSYFQFVNGNSILITHDEIRFGGNIDEKLIGGPDIIILSRLHNRAVLHGSAFSYHDKAYMVCACPGAGKSTLSAAMTKYHKDIAVLTDDIISIDNSGISVFKGLPHVSLNKDSCDQLFADADSSTIVSSNSDKSTIRVGISNITAPVQNYKIGGVFFLYPPLTDKLMEIQKYNSVEFFCEALKNIKFRRSLVEQTLSQEMKIIHNMVSLAPFGVKLRIKHDYSKLQEITGRIVDYIETEKQNES